METTISLGVLTGVSWGASKHHEKWIAANDKKERREQRHHQAEIQRHKLRADFEREKREIAERERSRTSKQLEVTRFDYHGSFAQQLACADSGGYITCIQPGASTLHPASNGSSSVLNAVGGALGLSPTTYIIALLLILLLAATGIFFFITDQLRQHCGAKDENVEQLNIDLTTMVHSQDDAKQQLPDSEQHQQASKARAEELEISLADAKNSPQSETILLEQAKSDRDMYKNNSEMRQQQVEESGAESWTLHGQLTSLQKERDEYKIASEQSTTNKQQLETSLAEVKDSLDHANQELDKLNTELRYVKRNHNSHEVLVRRVVAKCGEHIRGAHETHLSVKYGLLWRLRVRTKRSVPVAVPAADVLDGENENEGSDNDDKEEAEDSSTPDVNRGAERSAEGEKFWEQGKPDEGSKTNERENTEEEQKTDEERQVEHKKTPDQDNSTGEASKISQSGESNGDKGGNNGRKKKRGMRPALRKRLIEEGVLEPWRDPKWIDPATGLPSNGMPPKHLREQRAAEKAQNKWEGKPTKAKPADTKQNMLPATAPQPPLGAPTAPRAMTANGSQGPPNHGNDGPFPMRNHQNRHYTPPPPVDFTWANQSLAQSTQQEAELQNQAAPLEHDPEPPTYARPQQPPSQSQSGTFPSTHAGVNIPVLHQQRSSSPTHWQSTHLPSKQ
ncbi:hypothetical protein AC579_6969 [Pseudocercospora musae]|uniref:Uncharacterized protein n=1 Tax=Pseudocercospora musae TaxID=113226 RepID=A0A139IAE9_9PEZI|nr:hypothetical protein AC579_6969 [Pseudocercospora musae]